MTKPRRTTRLPEDFPRGLELVGLIRGVPTPEQVDELARALCAAANDAAGADPAPQPKRAKRRKR